MATKPLIATLKLHLSAGFTEPTPAGSQPRRGSRPRPAAPSGLRFREHCVPGSDPVPQWLQRVWGWF